MVQKSKFFAAHFSHIGVNDREKTCGRKKCGFEVSFNRQVEKRPFKALFETSVCQTQWLQQHVLTFKWKLVLFLGFVIVENAIFWPIFIIT